MIVGVLVELSSKNIDRVFDYKVPKDLENKIKIGIRVAVPFGRQTIEGFVLELKDNVKIFEAVQIDQDQKLFKSVTKSLQNFWFESSRVKELLRNYPEKLTEENLPNVVKWVISEMWK